MSMRRANPWPRRAIAVVLFLVVAVALWIWVFPWIDETFVNAPQIGGEAAPGSG